MTHPDPNQPSPASASPAIAPAAGQTAPHRPPDDAEEVYYEGSPLVRGALGRGMMWLLAGLALMGVAAAAAVRHWRFLPWWAWLIVAIVGLLLWFVPIIQSKTIRYRVSNYRIDFERGFLSKDIDSLELWHVEDIRFHQSLIDRVLDIGDITVISHDETMPLLVMRAVPHPRPLYEQLKQRIIAVKRSRGVIKMDPG